jgi:hypothetical protein
MPRGMLGKKARVVDSRIATLRDRVGQTALPYPVAADWGSKVKAWPMLANDQVGDCTCAAVFHMIQCWCANNGQIYTPTDGDALALYSIVGGYPQKDDGAVETDVLNYWVSHGIPGCNTIDEPLYCTLTPGDMDELRYATANFGGAYIGLALPLTAQFQNAVGGVWDVVQSTRAGAADPGSWGGHAVNVVGYDDTGVDLVTWGAVQRATWAFMQKYCDEAYGVVSEEWLADSGLSPTGLNMAALREDMGDGAADPGVAGGDGRDDGGFAERRD